MPARKSVLPDHLRQYFLDHINFANKFDSEMALTHNLFVNIDEFANMGPSQQGKLKQDIATATSACHQCGIEFEKRHCISPYPVINDEQVALKTQAQIASLCGEEVLGDCDRWYASECYSAYLNRYPGALGFLGIRNAELGSGAAHHNGKFDMDESALILGVYAETAFVLSK